MKSFLWKSYFWFIAISFATLPFTFYFNPVKNYFAFVLDFITLLFNVIGIYSYIYNKKLLPLKYWEILNIYNIVSILLDFLYQLAPHAPIIKYLSILSENGTKYSLTTMIVGSLLVLPLIYAIFQISKNIYLPVKKKGKPKIIYPNRFVRWSLNSLFILFGEFSLILLFSFLTQKPGLGIDDSNKIIFWSYQISAITFPLLTYFINFKKYTFKRNILFPILSFVVLVVILFSYTTYTVITQKPEEPVVSKKYSSDDVFNAINESRVKNGVDKLQKNPWVCKLAQQRLNDNLKVGNGYFADNDGYDVAIKNVTDQYNKASAEEKRQSVPEIDMEYVFYSHNLDRGMKLLSEDKGDDALFYQKTLTYGCVAASKGYAEIVTATDPLYEVKYDGIGI